MEIARTYQIQWTKPGYYFDVMEPVGVADLFANIFEGAGRWGYSIQSINIKESRAEFYARLGI